MNCAEGWQEILDFGEQRLHILKKYFSYSNGLPSVSTLLRVMGMIDKKCFETWLQANTGKMLQMLKAELI